MFRESLGRPLRARCGRRVKRRIRRAWKSMVVVFGEDVDIGVCFREEGIDVFISGLRVGKYMR